MSLTSETDWLAFALSVWAIESARPGLLMIGAGLLLAVVFGNTAKRTPQRPREQPEVDVRRPTNTALWRRLWWMLRAPSDMMTVDGLQIDRSRKPHCLWLGPTGAGKSASVATVRLDRARATLGVMPDLSDPLRARADFVWTACVGPVAINFLIGTPTEVAERLTEVFRSGGTGAWKRAARRRTAQVIRELDDAGEPRSLLVIAERLQAAVAHDRNLALVCAGWVDRFADLADQFGESIGAGGVDLAALLRDGLTVVLDNDAFEHASLGGDVVALGLAEAKRCANLVPGGFRLVFEEAGQLGERIDLADPFFRAGRRRRITVDALTQAESDLNEAISANSATRVYFAQELKSLQKTAADRLGLDYRELDPARMRDFTAWVAHGKIRRLVRFPKPPNTLPSVADGPIGERTDGRVRTDGRRTEVLEVWHGRYAADETVVGEPMQPALPPPSVVLEKLLRSIYPEGECERWGGKHDKDGYGLVWLDGRWQKVHRVRWEMAYGSIPRNSDGTTMTIDHLREKCPNKDCSKLVHLELLERGAHSRREHQRRRFNNAGGSGGRREASR